MESIGQVDIDVDRKIDDLVQFMTYVRNEVVACVYVLVHKDIAEAYKGGSGFCSNNKTGGPWGPTLPVHIFRHSTELLLAGFP